VAANDEGATHVPLERIGIIAAAGRQYLEESLTNMEEVALSSHLDAYPSLDDCMQFLQIAFFLSMKNAGNGFGIDIVCRASVAPAEGSCRRTIPR
jgi:hypothetical protein